MLTSETEDLLELQLFQGFQNIVKVFHSCLA